MIKERDYIRDILSSDVLIILYRKPSRLYVWKFIFEGMIKNFQKTNY